MSSNVYTKNQILDELAAKGFFVDAYTLDTFFKIWKIDAIFEDEHGDELFDKNALDMALNNLFSPKEKTEDKAEEQADSQQNENEKSDKTPDLSSDGEQPSSSYEHYDEYNFNDLTTEKKEAMIEIPGLSDREIPIPIVEDEKVQNALDGIVLSNGQSLSDELRKDFAPQQTENNIGSNSSYDDGFKNLMGSSEQQASGENPDESEDFDDLSLLSESIEAQEKFRDYLVSEMHKKNFDINPMPQEVNIDEKAMDNIARAMAKKIAKHVSSLCAMDAKSAVRLEEATEAYNKLELKVKELEKQNKKLRLLLVESNRNLNSYKPTYFGLYKKVAPKNETPKKEK